MTLSVPFGPPAGDPSQNDIVPSLAVAVTLAGVISSVVQVGSGPAVGTSGTPSNTTLDTFVVTITTGGSRGTAVFSWSKNGGAATTGVATAASVSLADGVSVTFPTGTYVLNTTYTFTATSGDFSMVGQFKAGYCREIFCGVGGTIVAALVDGNMQTYQNIQSGSVLSGMFTAVAGTNNGTTASGLLARW